MPVKLYDSTLREGTQSEDVAFSVEDKVRIAHRLDEVGVHYIEGGWPASNPRDFRFFRQMRAETLRQATLVVFGSTPRRGLAPEVDPNLRAMLEAGARAATVFGKSWDVHVREALGMSLEENVRAVADCMAYLKQHFREVFFDAEHFFDGFKANPQYALSVVEAAWRGGADCVVLCDTNGGTLPHELEEIIRAFRERLPGCPFGIHAHDDAGMAVANTVLAVRLGATQVQGTVNGYGERCGNADLCVVIPNLVLKLGVECLPPEGLRHLRELSRFVAELANLPCDKHQPYVGESAFAHKAGVHVSAVERNPRTYEHVDPELVGNRRRVLISDLSGRSNVVRKAREFGLELAADHPAVQRVLEELKSRELDGYQFEGAEASFELMLKRALGLHREFFELRGFRVICEKRGDEPPLSEATIMVSVGGKVEHTAAMGNGPVNALDNALRKALERFYPHLREVELRDYKVRVLDGQSGTASKVRVLIESGDGVERWNTVGVSENIIEASWQALVDSIRYKLLRDEERA